MLNPKPRTFRRRSDRGHGQALVEFALVIPIFLVVLALVLYFGFMLYSKMTVINAAREGARAGAMTADPTTIATNTGVIKNRVISAAAAAGLTLLPANVTIGCLQTTVSTSSPPTCNWTLYNITTNPTGPRQGDSVTVTVTYALGNPIPMHLRLLGNVIIDLPSTINLSSTVQMVLDNVTSG